MGLLYFLVGLLFVLIIASVVVLWTYLARSSKQSTRERTYSREMERLGYRKIAALQRQDTYELAEIAGQEQALRERYVNGEAL